MLKGLLISILFAGSFCAQGQITTSLVLPHEGILPVDDILGQVVYGGSKICTGSKQALATEVKAWALRGTLAYKTTNQFSTKKQGQTNYAKGIELTGDEIAEQPTIVAENISSGYVKLVFRMDYFTFNAKDLQPIVKGFHNISLNITTEDNLVNYKFEHLDITEWAAPAVDSYDKPLDKTYNWPIKAANKFYNRKSERQEKAFQMCQREYTAFNIQITKIIAALNSALK